MVPGSLRVDDVYCSHKPETPRRHAKTVPDNIERHVFAPGRVWLSLATFSPRKESKATSSFPPVRTHRPELPPWAKVRPLIASTHCRPSISCALIL